MLFLYYKSIIIRCFLFFILVVSLNSSSFIKTYLLLKMNRRKFIGQTFLGVVSVGVGKGLLSCTDDSTCEYRQNNQINTLLAKHLTGKNKIYIVDNKAKGSIPMVYYKYRSIKTETLQIKGYLIAQSALSKHINQNRNLVVKPYTNRFSIVEYITPIKVRLFNRHIFKCISFMNVMNNAIDVEINFI